MLSYKLLRNHAGILLCGDYTTLTSLYRVVHAINEQSPIIKEKEGSFLGLAYDLRMAYQGQRRVIKSEQDFIEVGLRFGVEILWPVLLIQSRMLRASMAFINTDKLMQAHAYALEAVIEDALKKDFGADLGLRLIDRWMAIDPAHPWVESKIESRGGYFSALSKAERKKKLEGVLFSFNPMYPLLVKGWIRDGAKDMPLPEQLDAWEGMEWPDPRW